MHCDRCLFRSDGRMTQKSCFAKSYRQVEWYLLSEEVSTVKSWKNFMKRALEEVRYAVIGVPFLRISFQASFPGRAQLEIQ